MQRIKTYCTFSPNCLKVLEVLGKRYGLDRSNLIEALVFGECKRVMDGAE